MLAIAVLGVASGPSALKKVDLSGPVEYSKDGVELAGRKVLWKELSSLEDVAPSLDATKKEFAERVAKRPDDVASHLKLAIWARACGLADEAHAEFEAALALDPENAEARRALGWVMVAKEWKRVDAIFAEKRKLLASDAKAEKLELAKWCGEHGDPDDEWKLLVELAAADPYDKGMIARVKPIVEKRRQQTALTPPLTGTWRAELDKTKHHQAKVFAIEAIDFRMVDASGNLFRGDGKRLEDFFGFDQVIRACADGTVTMVDDQFADLPPGVAGKYDEANYVAIDHAHGESTDYGHIRQHSALVKVGDVVKAGQPIARVGNSGASGQPHLHFTLDTWAADEAGNGQWIGLAWRLSGFRVVQAGGAPCDFHAIVARVQEGWTVQFPERE